MTMDAVSREVRLVRRPVGWPVPADFALAEATLPEPTPGEVRVRNELLSVDPYMRGRMDDRPSYVAPYALDEAMTGRAAGRVVASADPNLPVGTLVVHQLGWRTVAQGPAAGFTTLPEVPGVDLAAHLGVAGMTGLTAWVGLTRVARLAPGDVVFVSGAAGAVGSAAGQLARRLGAARVIGSAGSAAKVATAVRDHGFDAALDYRSGPVGEQLAALAPDGIDVYFDNVGGDHLEAAIDVLRPHGRVAVCGAISSYNAAERPPGPRNLEELVTKGLTLQGFRLGDHLDAREAFLDRVLPWIAEGVVGQRTTEYDGVDRAVEAFLAMMAGRTVGKTLVRTAPPSA